MMRKWTDTVLLFGLISALSGCATIPKGAIAVDGFEKAKYLGQWYEVARFDFIFEKDLNNTTAEYTLLPNGLIGVTNRGYNFIKNKWSQATGTAKFRGQDTVGELEVSFFGPFYAPYNILAIDGDYQYALIAGESTEYLWILSRTKEIPASIRERYTEIAQKIGYDTTKLIWVEHNGEE